MDYQLTDAYRRLIETRDALDKLHYALCGSWPMEHETPADIADRIQRAVTRERETARNTEQEALL